MSFEDSQLFARKAIKKLLRDTSAYRKLLRPKSVVIIFVMLTAEQPTFYFWETFLKYFLEGIGQKSSYWKQCWQ